MTAANKLDVGTMMDQAKIDELIAEHSEWTPQGYAIVDSHRLKFARALLASKPAESESWEFRQFDGWHPCTEPLEWYDRRAFQLRKAKPAAPAQSAVPNKAFASLLMDAAAKSGDEGTIKLAAQLGGVAPCGQCGFVNYHCRCTVPAAPAQSGEPDKWVAKVRVTANGYAMELSKYIAYALPEGIHELYAAPQPAQTERALTDAPEFDAKHVSLNERADGKLVLTLLLDGVEGAPRYKVRPVNNSVVRATATQPVQTFEQWASDPQRADKIPLAKHANGAYSDTRSYLIYYGWKSALKHGVAQPTQTVEQLCPRCESPLSQSCNCDAAYALRAGAQPAQTARTLTTEQIDKIRDRFSGIEKVPSRATVQRVAMAVLAMTAAQPASGGAHD
ncbi:hypothetical protein [Paraburkholderia domus]|uniref:hypothetical protein n=1 Tax=Paraburkholderia domus TaxID=2793075 RepID=UPI001911B335|nr:hypothetical protein [Paraburkholderia domus]MBK5061804.1 hypothetical protein [Burkholderia sp. R-70199]CAE6900830.1 hypothetical protein R70199_03684 [Paraburkholderia domus]